MIETLLSPLALLGTIADKYANNALVRSTIVKIHLLTHPKEPGRPTNTGQLVLRHVNDTQTQHHCQLIIWSRVSPDPNLLTLIRQDRVAMLSTTGTGPVLTPDEIGEYEHFLVIDSTWQEARKIFNRSPYLHPLPRIELTATQPSQFTLRANQIPGGLSTAESVIELLRLKNEMAMADTLAAGFGQFVASAR